MGSISKRYLTGLNSEFSWSYQDSRAQSALLYTHSWRENGCIHTFPISAMWNTNNLVQDLNSWPRVHFPTSATITHTHTYWPDHLRNITVWFSKLFFPHIYIYIYLSLSSSRHAARKDFPDFHSIRSYHPSLPVGFRNYIMCLHRADVNKFFLFSQHWYVHVLGSIDEPHLWARPYFSNNVPSSLIYIYIYIYIFTRKKTVRKIKVMFRKWSNLIRINMKTLSKWDVNCTK